MSEHSTRQVIQRAQILLQQDRPREARAILMEGMAHDPHEPTLLILLSIAQRLDKRLDEALEAVTQAIGIDPNLPWAHHERGSVLLDLARFDEAKAAAKQAMLLNPEDEDHYGLLAAIAIRQDEWEEALSWADRGLELAPDHQSLLNLRGLALTQLGRQDEAHATLASSLAEDPEDAFSHANKGWALLHGGKAKEAIPHLREALRLEPSMDYARLGLIEAIKGSQVVFGLMLRCQLWLTRQRPQHVWGLVAILIMVQHYGSALHRGPIWAAAAWDLYCILSSLFIYLLIFAPFLGDLLLRLHHEGRHLLTPRRRRTANWILAGTTFGALISGLWLYHTFHSMAPASYFTFPLAVAYPIIPACTGTKALWRWVSGLAALAMAACLLLPWLHSAFFRLCDATYDKLLWVALGLLIFVPQDRDED